MHTAGSTVVHLLQILPNSSSAGLDLLSRMYLLLLDVLPADGHLVTAGPGLLPGTQGHLAAGQTKVNFPRDVKKTHLLQQRHEEAASVVVVRQEAEALVEPKAGSHLRGRREHGGADLGLGKLVRHLGQGV